MNNKWIYIIFLCLIYTKSVTDVMSTYDNGSPKSINTYDVKKDGLKLKEQAFFYQNGTLKAKGILKRDTWQWSYYSVNGEKSLEPIKLDESNVNLNNAITEVQNNQLMIVKQLQALANEQQILKKSLASKNQNSKKQERPKKKQERPKADPNKVYDIPIGKSVVLGNPTAKVTIIEWTDFQ